MEVIFTSFHLEKPPAKVISQLPWQQERWGDFSGTFPAGDSRRCSEGIAPARGAEQHLGTPVQALPTLGHCFSSTLPGACPGRGEGRCRNSRHRSQPENTPGMMWEREKSSGQWFPMDRPCTTPEHSFSLWWRCL